MPPLWRCRPALLAAALLSQTTCSKVRLEFPEREQELVGVDDKLRLQGEFCTSPAANVVYPVKIMFIVDGSGSQQFSDQNRQRVVAVTETIQALIGSGATFFKIIVFNASVTPTPPIADDEPVYTNDLARIAPGLDNVAQADTVTDYQGALSVAYSEMVRDMESVRNDPLRGFAELGRTKYVTVFMSDGFPDPQCKVGLGNDFDPNFPPDNINLLCEDADYIACIMQAGNCTDGTLCRSDADCVSGGGCSGQPTCANDPGNGGAYVCTSEDGETSCFAPEDSSSLFGGLGNITLLAGNDYNQPYQILKLVQDIMDLEDRYQVGEMRFNSALVLDPLADPAIVAIFGDTTQAIPLMQQMAAVGDGDYLEFYGGDSIDFGSLNFDSLKQTRVIRGFFVQAVSNRLTEGGNLADTDFDGMVDEDEYDAGTNPLRADTDGDGYGDYIEHTKRGFGFDPNDPCLPAIVDMSRGGDATLCTRADPRTWVNCDHDGFGAGATYFDDDFDGLTNCEERAVGTDPRIPDTDADGLIDQVDVYAGLSPTVWDYDRDLDQDGIPNGREIEWHLNPLVFQSDVESREHYRYVRNEIGKTIDGRTCYSFDVRHVHLAATGISEDITPPTTGINEIRLYILENMSDNLSGVPLVRVACLRPRYVPPTLKVPATGDVNDLNGDLVDRDGNSTDALTRQREQRFFRYLATQDPIANTLQDVDYFNSEVDCQVLQ